MSYSRWSNGSWYVFWDAAQSGENKEDQALACWYSMEDADQQSWKFDRVDDMLRESFDYIVRIIQLRYNCSPDEANELQEYMQEWRNDVRNKFSA